MSNHSDTSLIILKIKMILVHSIENFEFYLLFLLFRFKYSILQKHNFSDKKIIDIENKNKFLKFVSIGMNHQYTKIQNLANLMLVRSGLFSAL